MHIPSHATPAEAVHSGDAAGPDHPRRILDAAAGLLRQGIDLLGVLTTETYTHRVAVAFNGSIGGHYRHCLDHFSSLLNGLDSDLVDYDRRERDPRLEADPEFARGVTRRMLAAFEGLEPSMLATPVTVRCEVSYEHGGSPATRSTLGRELAYAIAHGIHHYALIGVMARLQEARLPETFGVAPSTLAHRREVSRD